MNQVVIEEHQVRDLVFAQAYYLYISLEATSACVIVPIAKVPRTKYSSCYDRGLDFSARLLTGYDYGIPQVSSCISHGQSSQSAGSITCMIVTHS